jgi:hypothetical protein
MDIADDRDAQKPCPFSAQELSARIGIIPLPGSTQIRSTERAAILIPVAIWNHVLETSHEPIAGQGDRRLM